MLRNFQTWLNLLLVLALLSSCSPTAKLRKAEKLINEAEQAGLKWHVDTVTVKIPYSVPEIMIKEVHHALPGDTVVLEKERLRIKYVRLPGDSVFIEGKCEADTIYKSVPITINKTIKAKGYSLWQLIVLAIIALLAGYGGRAFFKK